MAVQNCIPGSFSIGFLWYIFSWNTYLVLHHHFNCTIFDNDGPWEDTTIDEPELFQSDPSEFKKIEEENDLCDCDPDHKESQTVQRSAGASLGGFGAQMEDGTTVIVCTKCGGRFYEDESYNQDKNGFDPIF